VRRDVNPYTKAAHFCIRLVAFTIILVSALYVAPDVVLLIKKPKQAPGIGGIILRCIPMLVGIGIWIKSYGWARALTSDFDE
jgi:hypothetical protein